MIAANSQSKLTATNSPEVSVGGYQLAAFSYSNIRRLKFACVQQRMHNDFTGAANLWLPLFSRLDFSASPSWEKSSTRLVHPSARCLWERQLWGRVEAVFCNCILWASKGRADLAIRSHFYAKEENGWKKWVKSSTMGWKLCNWFGGSVDFKGVSGCFSSGQTVECSWPNKPIIRLQVNWVSHLLNI